MSQRLTEVARRLEEVAAALRAEAQLLGTESKGTLVLTGELRRWESDHSDQQKTWLKPPASSAGEGWELVDFIMNYAIDEGLVKSQEREGGVVWYYVPVRITVEFLEGEDGH